MYSRNNFFIKLISWWQGIDDLPSGLLQWPRALARGSVRSVFSHLMCCPRGGQPGIWVVEPLRSCPLISVCSTNISVCVCVCVCVCVYVCALWYERGWQALFQITSYFSSGNKFFSILFSFCEKQVEYFHNKNTFWINCIRYQCRQNLLVN